MKDTNKVIIVIAFLLLFVFAGNALSPLTKADAQSYYQPSVSHSEQDNSINPDNNPDYKPLDPWNSSFPNVAPQSESVQPSPTVPPTAPGSAQIGGTDQQNQKNLHDVTVWQDPTTWSAGLVLGTNGIPFNQNLQTRANVSAIPANGPIADTVNAADDLLGKNIAQDNDQQSGCIVVSCQVSKSAGIDLGAFNKSNYSLADTRGLDNAVQNAVVGTTTKKVFKLISHDPNDAQPGDKIITVGTDGRQGRAGDMGSNGLIISDDPLTNTAIGIRPSYWHDRISSRIDATTGKQLVTNVYRIQ